MTVKTELERLKKQKEDLEKERSLRQNRLDEELLPQEKNLQKKGEELSKRTSPLAQTLQAKNQKELEEIQQSIKRERKYLAGVEQELQDTQARIDARENDATLYIQEQAKLMVESFLWWVENNKEAIGYDITRSFIVAGVTSRINGREGPDDYPTGEVGVFEKGEKSHGRALAIVLSQDFYFNQNCYEVESSGYGAFAKQTQWYTQYLKDFIAAFLKKLEESYNLGEELKLTIKNPEFTLELV